MPKPTRARALGLACSACTALVVVVAIAACGGNGRAPAHQTTPRSPSAIDYSFRPAALVTMRQYSPESLLWQSVSVDADGAALLTTLIGEISGATRKSFQLPPGQATILRRLVAAARRVPPPAGRDPRAELYTLHISGKPAANIEGPMPKPLAALVHFLSGLMLAQCC